MKRFSILLAALVAIATLAAQTPARPSFDLEEARIADQFATIHVDVRPESNSTTAAASV